MDTPCQICHLLGNDRWAVLCETCDQPYHTYCLTPPLPGIPRGKWHCPVCVPPPPAIESDISSVAAIKRQEAVAAAKQNQKSTSLKETLPPPLGVKGESNPPNPEVALSPPGSTSASPPQSLGQEGPRGSAGHYERRLMPSHKRRSCQNQLWGPAADRDARLDTFALGLFSGATGNQQQQ